MHCTLFTTMKLKHGGTDTLLIFLFKVLVEPNLKWCWHVNGKCSFFSSLLLCCMNSVLSKLEKYILHQICNMLSCVERTCDISMLFEWVEGQGLKRNHRNVTFAYLKNTSQNIPQRALLIERHFYGLLESSDYVQRNVMCSIGMKENVQLTLSEPGEGISFHTV